MLIIINWMIKVIREITQFRICVLKGKLNMNIARKSNTCFILSSSKSINNLLQYWMSVDYLLCKYHLTSYFHMQFWKKSQVLAKLWFCIFYWVLYENTANALCLWAFYWFAWKNWKFDNIVSNKRQISKLEKLV